MLYKLPTEGYKFISNDGKDDTWIENIDAEDKKNYVPNEEYASKSTM